MQKRRIGKSDLEVSVVGLGCNNLGGRLDEAASLRVVAGALDLGVTLFDTADVYPKGKTKASEDLLGRALKGRRSGAVIATKFGLPMEDGGTAGGSRNYILGSVETSLKRLGTDWIDLYQLHAPDPSTPIDETLAALHALVKSGKVRHIGCSNFAAWELADANWRARVAAETPFVSIQNEYSLLNREPDREVIPACGALDVGFLPFFPLASGLLSGKYKRGEAAPSDARLAYNKFLGDRFLSEANLGVVAALQSLCDKRGWKLLDVAFSWLLTRPVVSSVIAGASTPEQVRQNIEATKLAFTSQDLKEIDEITGAERYARSHG